jgi:predicted permease
MGSLWQDVRYGLRWVANSPGFTITVLVSLALGVGATTAVFSVIRAVLLSPYPYAAADRIVSVIDEDAAGNENAIQLSGSQLLELKDAKSVESVLAQQDWELSETGGDVPHDVKAVFLTTNASSFFGVPALVGRWLVPSDAADGQDAQLVAVLSYGFWQRRFAGNADAVGKSLEMDHRRYTIVGVLPKRFAWTYADVYLPLKLRNDPTQPLGFHLKLRPGVNLQAADAEFQSLFEGFARETPTRYPEKFRVRTERIIDQYGPGLRRTLYPLFGAVLVLLLIGCVNVSILLLARGKQREHEMAVRSALGASRARILRQLLTESLALSISGAALGVLCAYATVGLIVKWMPEYSYPAEAAIQINVPVLCFSIGLAVLTGVLFGLWPALQLSRREVSQTIQSSAHRITSGVSGKQAHAALIAAQIAMTLLLLTASGAGVQGFLRLMHTTLGYDPHNVLLVSIPIHEKAYLSWGARAAYFNELRGRVAAIPGVVSASISSQSTPPINGWPEKLEIMGRPSLQGEDVSMNLVSPQYFSVLGIPLLRGRMWDQAETMRGARVAVINETMARQYWPTADALTAIRFPEVLNDPPLRFAAPGSDQWFEIVGVVADSRDDGLTNAVKPAVYLPYTIWLGVFPEILARTSGPPLAFLQAVRAQISSVDPGQQVAGDEGVSLEDVITSVPEWQRAHLVTVILSAFGLLALSLAVVGLYSVVSYTVAQRTNEFGIRMALGAQPSGVLRLVFGSTTVSVGTGLATGVLLSVILSKVLARWLEASAGSPVILVVVTLLLICVSTLAAFFPARRASSLAPMDALRHE